MIQLTVPAQIKETQLQLTTLGPELEQLKKAINKTPLSRMITGGVPTGELLGVIATIDDREFSPKRITKITLGLFSRSDMPDLANILRFRVAYHLFCDGEGTCYRTTDQDSHGNTEKFRNLTVALSEAVNELREGIEQIRMAHRANADDLMINVLRLRNEL